MLGTDNICKQWLPVGTGFSKKMMQIFTEFSGFMVCILAVGLHTLS